MVPSISLPTFLTTSFCLLLFFPAPVLPAAGQTEGSVELSRDLEHQTFDLINAYRTAHDLPALTWSHEIAELARRHSRDMATGEVDFGHDGFRDRMDALKGLFPALRGGGENVFESDDRDGIARFAVANWLQSPPHLHNIRGDYNYSGLGLWRSKTGAYYFTQIFIKAGG